MNRNGNIDWKVIQDLSVLNPGLKDKLLKEILDIYRQSAPTKIQNIKQAIVDKNKILSLGEAHSLKSSSGYLGAVEVSKICEEIRKLVEAEGFDKALQKLEALQRAYEKAVESLMEYLKVT